jgi:hypothetical protein
MALVVLFKVAITSAVNIVKDDSRLGFLNETNARLGYFMNRIHPNEIVFKTPHVHFEVRFIPLMCIENPHEPIEMVHFR